MNSCVRLFLEKFKAQFSSEEDEENVKPGMVGRLAKYEVSKYEYETKPKAVIRLKTQQTQYNSQHILFK